MKTESAFISSWTVRNKKLKKIKALLPAISLTAALILSSCGATLDLTDEEVARVVNYSANILEKHNTQQRGTLSDVSDTALATLLEEEDMQAAEEARRAERRRKRQEEEAAAAETEAGGGAEEAGVNSSPLIDANAVEFTSIADILGISGFSIDYTGYEIKSTYPESVSENDLMFGINASEGDELLVLKFDVKNLGQEKAHCSVLDKDPSFRLKINRDRHSLLKTLLMDDLATFDEDLEAGEVKQAVLIAEISDAKAASIESIVLTLRKDGQERQMVLQGSGSGGQIALPSGDETAAEDTDTVSGAEAGEGSAEMLDQEEFDELFGDVLEGFEEDSGTDEE